MQMSTTPQYNSHDRRLNDLNSKDHLRTERLFNDAGLWYFRTREGNDVGPFRYRCEAETMLGRFLQDIQERQQQSMASAKPHFRTVAVLGKRQPG
jgi:ABC-type ATPase with predicted acetyltransferase domain